MSGQFMYYLLWPSYVLLTGPHRLWLQSQAELRIVSQTDFPEEAMRIAVIGAGNVGSTLGRRWADAGHEVAFGVRDRSAPKYAGLHAQAKLMNVREAPVGANIVVLATPWDATQ